MTNRKSTLKQRYFIDSLVKQLGLEALESTKKSLRIKKEVKDLSVKTCGRLIDKLLTYEAPKSNLESEMGASIKMLRYKLNVYKNHHEPWMDTDYDRDGKFIG